MPDIYLIRHSVTAGNLESRYVGSRTDESLCTEGVCLLEKMVWPPVERVFASPMKRCLETARILYPDMDILVEESLRECDFGEFENKNYKELSGNEAYQRWIDSGGVLPFPGGESREIFSRRCVEGFSRCVSHCLAESFKTAALVVHGGTIMSILSVCAQAGGDYFSWQVKNGEGYLLRVDAPVWEKTGKIEVLEKFTQEGLSRQ